MCWLDVGSLPSLYLADDCRMPSPRHKTQLFSPQVTVRGGVAHKPRTNGRTSINCSVCLSASVCCTRGLSRLRAGWLVSCEYGTPSLPRVHRRLEPRVCNGWMHPAAYGEAERDTAHRFHRPKVQSGSASRLPHTGSQDAAVSSARLQAAIRGILPHLQAQKWGKRFTRQVHRYLPVQCQIRWL